MEAGTASSRTRWQAAFVVLLTVLALSHIYAVFTENVNWDEFALLQRAETAAKTGVVSGGGRPGLATALLMPAARACVNGVDALRTVRVWWLIPTFGAAWAFWILLGTVVPLFAYSRPVRLGTTPATMLGVSSGLDAFAYYRQWVGWQYYRAIASTLLPHFLLIVGLIPITVASLQHPRQGSHRELATGWVLLAAGTTVLFFHAGRFPYFYMTLGLFSAAIGAIVSALALERLDTRWLRRGLLGIVWGPLVILGLGQTASLMQDTQGRQRESLAFVGRNFNGEVRGFEARGALVCRHDPDPFPVRFTQHVNTEFAGGAGAARGAQLVEEFRHRAIRFFISPFPSERYPAETWDFWRSRYTPYHAYVWLPGTRVGLETESFEAVAPGPYRWLPDAGASGPITVAGTIVEPGRSVELTAGLHLITAAPGAAGRLVLNVPEPGFPAEGTFYKTF